jgi:uncharacterized cofD-like protein
MSSVRAEKRTVKKKRIVVIGGGTGVFTVLSGLRKYPHELAAIVSMADDGGSTGVLREEFGILPPGDIRRALVALAAVDRKVLSDLFSYRFEEGWGFAGHSFGNVFLTALERLTGDFASAVKEASRLLGVKGAVIPVTLGRTTLFAELADGRVVKGETNIDIPKHDGRLKINRVYLKPRPRANPEALSAIRRASAIVIGPGDLYTSVIPNLLVSGVADALRSTKAKKIYVCNLMTKFGETYGFAASDFLRTLESYLGEGVLDYFIVNAERPSRSRLKPYIKERADIVEIDDERLPSSRPVVVKSALLRKGALIRHDPDKLARLIHMLI